VWNPQADDLSIDIKPSLQRSKHRQEDHNSTKGYEHLTKRQILPKVNSIYDPLGLMAPITVRAKILMRRINTEEFGKLDWDDPVPNTYQQEWFQFFEDLNESKEVAFKRTLKPDTAVGKPWLIVFSDAQRRHLVRVHTFAGVCKMVDTGQGSSWLKQD